MDWLIFILLILILWYWWDTLQSKEIARVAGQNSCQKSAVQFLDDTVALKKFWLRRSYEGSLQICRLYTFEFSSDGARRYSGRITLFGNKVSSVEMDAYRMPDDSG